MPSRSPVAAPAPVARGTSRVAAERDLIPVTVIGGYLGAGKTTIINHLLRQPGGRRLAVLVNDFGALDIDATLIASEGARTVSLSNGCVCCSISDALGDGLDEVLAIDPLPDQIVIEASGVADPAKIAVYGQGWPGVRLDAVTTVVDATTMATNAEDRFIGSLVLRQLAAADLVLLSKTDLLAAPALAEARIWLADRVASTPVLALRDGQVPADLVLDIQAGQRTESVASGAMDGAVDAETFWSTVLRLDQPIAKPALESALDRWPDAVVRVKGFVRTTEVGHPGYEVHRVGRRWTVEPTDLEAAPSALVIIAVAASSAGDGLSDDELLRDLIES